MFSIGLSTCGRKPFTDTMFAEYAANGIHAVEISVQPDVVDVLDHHAIAAMAARHGVELWSFHLPFWGRDRIDLEACADDAVAHFEQLIRKAAAVGIKKFVIHPSGEPIEEVDRGAHMRRAKKSLATLAEFAAAHDAVLAVEDLPRTCLGRDVEDMEELLSAHPALRVCFDTNHLLRGDPADFVRAMGDRIITTHVSDYDFINERHWLPGEGKLDWAALIQALEEIHYTGVWMYELGFACPTTLLRDRALTCGDFARNAQELFAGQPLTVLSTPKPDLQPWEL